jgi:hypothetical protein
LLYRCTQHNILSSLRAKALRTSFARSLSLTIGCPICTCTRHVVPRTCTVFYRVAALTIYYRVCTCSLCSLSCIHLYLFLYRIRSPSCALVFLSFVALMMKTSVHTQSRMHDVWDLKVLVWCKKYPAVAGYFIIWGRFCLKLKWEKDLLLIKIGWTFSKTGSCF